LSEGASEREKISDLGETYYLTEDFKLEQERLLSGETIIDHINDSKVFVGAQEHYAEFGAKSVMIVPLIVKGKIVGFADLWESRRHRDFTPAEIALSRAVAQQAGVAIENAQLFAEKQAQLRLATTLQAVGALLTTQLSIPGIFDQIFELLAEVITYDGASIQLIDNAGTIFVAAGTGFANSRPYKVFAGHHGDQIIARFDQGRMVRVIPDTETADDWIQVSDPAVIRSWIGAALMVQGRLIGVLNVDNLKPNINT
jgi:GAF domain-containing protein